MVPPHHIQNGLTSLYKYKKYIYRGPHGTSRAPPPGPLSGGGAPPARGPSGPGGSLPVIAHPLLQLLSGPRSATPPEHPHTAPGLPHPGSMTTCPQALPVVPPLSGDENPQTLPRPPPRSM
jgi:hypothetical protein